MIKVLIAEDEPPILRSLQQTIEDGHPDFQVIARAYDGEEAIQLIQECRPDVVFTDIRMPIKDGTEVLEFLRVHAPDTLSVVVSGYQDFDYVRKALQSKALDYLLKPISRRETRNILEKIAENFYAKAAHLEEAFFSELVNKSRHDSNMPSSLSEYTDFFVVTVCLGAFPIDATIITRASELQQAWQGLKEGFQGSADTLWEVRGKTSFERILIMGRREAATDAFSARIAERQHAFCGSHPELPVTSLLNSSGMKLEDIPLAVSEFRRLLRKNVKIGRSQMLLHPQCLEDPNTYKKTISAVREKTLLHAFEHQNSTLFYEELGRLLQEWEEQRYPQVIVEKNLKYLATACQRIVALYGAHNDKYMEMEVNEAVSASLDYRMLFERVRVIFESLFMQAPPKKREEDLNAGMMETIDAYLQRNFTEPIDTQILADKIGRVPSYVSRLFRQYKGMTPTQYLIRLRIEKAKELIRSRPELRFKDIALMVGYEDPYYFSRIFKQKTGMGPSEYKAGFRE